MSSARLLALAGLAGLIAALAVCWLRLASPAPLSAYVLDPSHFALAAATAVAPFYAALVLQRRRRERLERHLLAVFLAAMPLMYLWGALLDHDLNAVFVEIVGGVVYVTWAVAGYRRSVLLLGLGIAAHGIGWDGWHHHADYIAPWYADMCFIVDVAFAIAIAAHERARTGMAVRFVFAMRPKRDATTRA
jgi:hypothetical protein